MIPADTRLYRSTGEGFVAMLQRLADSPHFLVFDADCGMMKTKGVRRYGLNADFGMRSAEWGMNRSARFNVQCLKTAPSRAGTFVHARGQADFWKRGGE